MPKRKNVVHINYVTGEITGGTAGERAWAREWSERNCPNGYGESTMRCEIDWDLMRKRAGVQGGAR